VATQQAFDQPLPAIQRGHIRYAPFPSQYMIVVDRQDTWRSKALQQGQGRVRQAQRLVLHSQ